ncbi:MAG: PAS domain S-box protein [Deltaproteobacteria bacterium]|nr:PAS domain S-box protein [Deltaproteobacteria bacterium]
MKFNISKVIRGFILSILLLLLFYSAANEPLWIKLTLIVFLILLIIAIFWHYHEIEKIFSDKYRHLYKKFEEIFNIVPEAIFIQDLNGKIAECNETTVRMYGYESKTEILKCNIGDLSASEQFFTEENAQKMIKKAIEEGYTRFEWLGRKKNGETLWEEVHLKKVLIENKTQILAVITDITQKKIKEEEERQKAIKYKILFETIPVGVIYQDSEGKIIDANNRAREILGLTHDQMIGRTSFDPRWKAVYEDYTDFPGEKHPSMVALREGKIIRDVIMGVFNPLDNKYHRINITATPLFNENETKPYMVYTVFEDVTEKRKAEKELLTTKRFLEQTGRLAKVGGWEKDLKTHEDIWSDITKEIHEVEKDFIPDMEKGINFYKEGEDREKIIKVVTHTIETGEPFDVELRIITAKGREKWVRAIGNAVFENGKCRKLFGAFQDIDEQKRTELRNIAERERWLNEIQNAQRLESLGLLAGSIAHDLNNMLSSFFGVLGIIKTMTDREEILDLLNMAEKNIDRARDFTNRLITFAKGNEPHKKITDIKNLIRQNAELVISGSNIQLGLSIDSSLNKAEIDPHQISQVIDNILINAREAINHKQGLINITAGNTEIREGEHPTLKAGKYIKISISDNGTGISKENINKVFDPFFTTKTNGHGLGLSISHSIMRKHGGTIEVSSEENKGSVFTLYLPSVSEEKRISVGQTQPSEGHIKQINNRKKRILVMDDEEDVRTIIQRMLERLNYEVICAQNGEEAIRQFNEEINSGRIIDIVILDLTVHGGTGGKETIAALRQTGRDFFAFVSSGYSDDPILTEPQRYGFNASIRKPFTLQELQNALSIIK